MYIVYEIHSISFLHHSKWMTGNRTHRENNMLYYFVSTFTTGEQHIAFIVFLNRIKDHTFDNEQFHYVSRTVYSYFSQITIYHTFSHFIIIIKIVNEQVVLNFFRSWLLNIDEQWA